MSVLKKARKYLLITFINLALMTMLLALWTDKLELVFNPLVRPVEFLKILAVSGLSLIAMRLMVSWFRYKQLSKMDIKIRVAVILTLLISAYLYFDYTAKIISNRIVNGSARARIAGKISLIDNHSNSVIGNGLNSQEYELIVPLSRFPKLPAEASDIQFSYYEDGFLPDYSFKLTYSLPFTARADTFTIVDGHILKYQTITMGTNTKSVTYGESRQ